MTHRLPRIFVFAPGAKTVAAFSAAASRAGALGVVDFDSVRSTDATLALTLTQAARLAARPFALRLPRSVACAEILSTAPDELSIVIGNEDRATGWGEFASEVLGRGRIPVAEVTSRESAREAIAAGVAGLIAAGHEAGGRGSDLSTFILTQDLLGLGQVEVWSRGGIGPKGAAACVGMGASGVVLDGSVLLARESPLGTSTRDRIARLDGGETSVIGPHDGDRWRVLATPGSPAVDALRRAADQGGRAWDEAVGRWIGWGDDQAWPIGQDAAFARGLADRFVTVGGIVGEVSRAIDAGMASGRSTRPLAEGAPLAESHRTRFPIVQGPMTRVSDSAAFASAVSDAGALPMIALAMLPGREAEVLLGAARLALAGRSWGVGLLGFIDPDLRRDQVAAVLGAKPPFALIAGGRPDQAVELERAGIATYLHAPSPGLLRQYVKDGARRFVFEGRECGGHVGPRSSLVLWEQALDVLNEAIDGGTPAEELHALFAGGIHDARSASAVASMAGPLAERGVKVGVLVGTAYLFTQEAVATRAIVPRFQTEALRCRQTVLLETGPGHEVRVGPSPFANVFEETRRSLLAEGRTAEAVREELERLNVGRLRIASKGLDRHDGTDTPLRQVPEADQFERGLYMFGQAAVLRDGLTTMESLHREVASAATLLPVEIPGKRVEPTKPSDVAIVGISAIFPGAADARTFWENTLKGLDAISEIPPDRWDWRPYYDADPKAPDRIISRWGGFVPDVAFDPLRYGMPPNSLQSIEPVQLLTLEAVRSAIEDAGYADRPFPRERTSVVLGIGGGSAQLAMGYAFRSYLPMLDAVSPGAGTEAMKSCAGLLPEWTEDAFPGFLLNVAAGRVANRFDLGGSNYAVDAACGSSLAAAHLAVRELEVGTADMVILGGADTVQNPLTYLAFSKTQAFSPRGRCRPFDASADGIVISEGVAAVVLKRLADAERDGDRIYAVIKGMGSSSDGRARGLTAPRPEGQMLALRRAYEKAGIDPKTVGYVEAHGTGTAVGDVVEAQALGQVLREAGAGLGSCAVGSVKSSIGHTKCAAGMAGLINAAMALHHKVLPPTVGLVEPNPKAGFAGGPLHVNPALRPWLHAEEGRPRRAGVSAFGFGGTNFHAVLEGYDRNLSPSEPTRREWPAELFAWGREDRGSLLDDLERLATDLGAGASPNLRDLSHAVLSKFRDRDAGPILAIVAESIADLRSKLKTAIEAIQSGTSAINDPRGLHYAEVPSSRGATVAFLFPGQGSQKVGMLGDLAIDFPVIREAFEEFDASLIACGRSPIGPRVFPPSAFDPEERTQQSAALRSPEAAQAAVGAASVGMIRLLADLGLRHDMAAGHSYGEFVALHAAGWLSAQGLAEVSEARGRFLIEAGGDEPGTMAALPLGPDRVSEVLNGWTDVVPVNFNGPGQTVIAGPREAVSRAIDTARSMGLGARMLSVACAFHTSLVSGAAQPLAALLRERLGGPSTIPVYSNLDAARHPDDPMAIASRMGRHLASPVKFAAMIERMHEDGARVFLECGPGGVLAPLVGSILGDRPHLAIAFDPPGHPGVVVLLHGLARLVASGVSLRLTHLTEGRSQRKLDLAKLPRGDGKDLPASTWLVNGSRARPIAQPETLRLGQVMPAKAPKPASEPQPKTAPVAVASPSQSQGIRPVADASNLPSTPPTEPSADGSDRVILAFQETMRRFLDVQRTTMSDYLASRGRPTPQPSRRPAHEAKAPELISRPTVESPPALGQDRVVAESEPTAIAPASSDPPKPIDQPGSDRHSIAEALVAIVRDRTGYPADMLRPDLDLEADLGIDSIKRVEILGSLRDAYPAAANGLAPSVMDDLARAKTLGAIAERFARVVAEGVATPTPPAAREQAAESASTVRRLILEAVPAEIADHVGLIPGGVVVITDDGRGIARALAEEIEAARHPTLVVGHGEGPGHCDFTSETAVERLLREVRRIGPLGGIVHGLPLRGSNDLGLDPSAWSERSGPELRGLFLLARAAAADLERSAEAGGSCLIAATGMGGLFGGKGDLTPVFPPWHGGITGLTKTLAREWPSVRVRCVDLDPELAAEALAGRLVGEIFANDPRSEVGHHHGRRLALASREAPLKTGRGEPFSLRAGTPLILTGGARGITASVGLELARRWRPNLLIVGTTPEPSPEEGPETTGIEEASRLKAALIDQARSRGDRPSASALEASYRGLLRAREIRGNLAALRALGAGVEYGVADVRDGEALRRLLDDWRARFGPPSGVIHGAGVIHDKLLRDKSPESFDRVYRTKVEGALNLLRSVDLDSLELVALFSSIAGRFGNRGQSDYAAANEVLNKLALWLDRRIRARVLSAIWGPWAGVGMVSDLEAHLGRQGLGMIPPGVGAARFADEVAWGRKGDVEIILSGALGDLELPPGPRASLTEETAR